MNNLKDFFLESSKAVEAELDRLLPQENIKPEKLHSAIRWSVFGGGKRFRPALVFAVGETYGANRAHLLRTAAAIEMIHTYSLIHDDLPAMDDDDLRRGRATCHKKFDEATAILAGDALQALAFQTIAGDESLTLETRVHLISLIASAAGTPKGMVGGQQLDLDAEGKQTSDVELDAIHRNKTGALIRASAVAGAVIANADSEEIEKISVYATNLGLLFQITDDIIDVSQTSEALGKTAGKDAAANKATYVSIYGLTEAAKRANDLFLKIEAQFGNSLLTGIARFVLERNS